MNRRVDIQEDKKRLTIEALNEKIDRILKSMQGSVNCDKVFSYDRMLFKDGYAEVCNVTEDQPHLSMEPTHQSHQRNLIPEENVSARSLTEPIEPKHRPIRVDALPIEHLHRPIRTDTLLGSKTGQHKRPNDVDAMSIGLLHRPNSVDALAIEHPHRPIRIDALFGRRTGQWHRPNQVDAHIIGALHRPNQVDALLKSADTAPSILKRPTNNILGGMGHNHDTRGNCSIITNDPNVDNHMERLPLIKEDNNSSRLKFFGGNVQHNQRRILEFIDPIKKEMFQMSVTCIPKTRSFINKNPLITLFKREDPGLYKVPCYIQGFEFNDTLCDSGASINIMSGEKAKLMGNTNLQPSKVQIALANDDVMSSKGVAKDVMVWNGPFLATVGVVINWPKRRVSFTFVNKDMCYEVLPTDRPPPQPPPVHFVRTSSTRL